MGSPGVPLWGKEGKISSTSMQSFRADVLVRGQTSELNGYTMYCSNDTTSPQYVLDVECFVTSLAAAEEQEAVIETYICSSLPQPPELRPAMHPA